MREEHEAVNVVPAAVVGEIHKLRRRRIGKGKSYNIGDEFVEDAISAAQEYFLATYRPSKGAPKTWAHFCALHGIKHAARHMVRRREIMSIHEPLGKTGPGRQLTLGDTLCARREENQIDQRDAVEHILGLIDNPRRREIAYQRGVLNMTLGEIGEQHNISRERVRQIIGETARALAKHYKERT